MLQQLELILRSVWAKVLWTATTGESLLGREVLYFAAVLYFTGHLQ